MRADGTLRAGDHIGSIHRVGALVQGLDACNGWTFWHMPNEGALAPIDESAHRSSGAISPQPVHRRRQADRDAVAFQIGAHRLGSVNTSACQPALPGRRDIGRDVVEEQRRRRVEPEGLRVVRDRSRASGLTRPTRAETVTPRKRREGETRARASANCVVGEIGERGHVVAGGEQLRRGSAAYPSIVAGHHLRASARRKARIIAASMRDGAAISTPSASRPARARDPVACQLRVADFGEETLSLGRIGDEPRGRAFPDPSGAAPCRDRRRCAGSRSCRPLLRRLRRARAAPPRWPSS